MLLFTVAWQDPWRKGIRKGDYDVHFDGSVAVIRRTGGKEGLRFIRSDEDNNLLICSQFRRFRCGHTPKSTAAIIRLPITPESVRIALKQCNRKCLLQSLFVPEDQEFAENEEKKQQKQERIKITKKETKAAEEQRGKELLAENPTRVTRSMARVKKP